MNKKNFYFLLLVISFVLVTSIILPLIINTTLIPFWGIIFSVAAIEFLFFLFVTFLLKKIFRS